MRRIYVRDGASFVWQWQPKEHIVLEDYPDGVFVRYSNCDTVEAPVVQTRRDGDKLIADIPPELMQVDKDITVYVCNEDGIIHCHFLSVVGAPKPASYIYEPVEVLRYESLAERIRLIEEWIANGGVPGGGITEETDPTVADWAKKGKPEPYGPKNMPPYPVSSVNGKSGAVQLGAADVGARPDNWMPTAQEVGALPAGTKIPAKTSDLSNDSGFITKSVADLVNYYTKTQTEDLIAQIPKFRISVVQQLPAAGEELVLYLVPFATEEGQYLEYIWTGGRFEVIGSQRVDLTGYATEVWVQAGYQPKGDYLLSTALSGAIDTALAEAKKSGAFDGADGADGRGIKSIVRTAGNGAAGTQDTYTITYTDNTKSTFTVRNGANGTNGKAGDDGITPHIGSNGNWYIGSTDTGIKAQGDKGDTGATGAAGKDGADGNTPVRGVDYWTAADQEAIVQQVIAALGTPVFGRVDADNNIILTGELADGTYTLKYEDGEGNVTEIGTLTQGGSGPAYTNLLPTYLVARDARYSSSVEPESHQKACPGAIMVAIPFGMMMGKTLRIKSPSIDKTSADGKPTSFSSVSYLGSFNGYVFNTGDPALAYVGCAVNEGNNTYSFLFTDENVAANWDPDSTMYATIIVNTAGTAVTDEELSQVVITLDEPIV